MPGDAPFYGRTSDPVLLDEKYDLARRELVVIYGRRRIGKSRLVQRFTRNKPALAF